MKMVKILKYSFKKEYLTLPVIVSLVLVLVNSFAELYFIKLIKKVFDTVWSPGGSGRFYWLLALALLLKVSILISGAFSMYFLDFYRRKVTVDNQFLAMKTFLTARYPEVIKLDHGDIARRIMSDAVTVSKFGPDILTIILKNLILLLGGIIILYFYSPAFFLLSLVFLLTYSSFSSFSVRKVQMEFERVRRIASKVTSAILRPIYNLLIVKVYSLENRTLRHLRAVLNQYNRAHLRAIMYKTVMSDFGNLLSTVYTFLMLAVAGVLMHRGNITFGTMVSALAIVQIIQRSADSVNSFLLSLSQAEPSYRRMVELEVLEKEKLDSGEVPDDYTIRFDRVSFGFDNRIILKDVSFTIKSGEWVGIVGRSGEGKTTLIRLLSGLFDSYQGSITVGGIEIRKIRKDFLRKIVTYVPQEDYILEGTIRENLSVVGEFSDRRLWESLKIAGLDEYVRSIGGLDVDIKHAKLILSGGERQRLSIARAYLKGGEIFIFDEILSQLDSIRERYILDTMRKIADGKTVIFIAHRISTVADLDRILVLEHGRIVDEGSHEELFERSRLYRELCKLQLVESKR